MSSTLNHLLSYLPPFSKRTVGTALDPSKKGKLCNNEIESVVSLILRKKENLCKSYSIVLFEKNI